MPKADLNLVSGPYAPVADRVALFYRSHPSGRIVTTLVSRADGAVTFRAAIYRNADDRRPSATGWALEREGDGAVNTFACRTSYPDVLTQTFDAAGNLDKRQLERRPNGNFTGAYDWFENQKHYYAADEKLRFVQRVVVHANDGTTSGILNSDRSGSWEEYWYDALGRRILLRSRRDSLTTGGQKRSHLDRFIWDGDHLLGEFRVPGQDNSSSLDADGGGVTDSTGTLAYIHGRAIDRPLALSDGRVILRTWKGEAEETVWDDGTAADCVRLLSGCKRINFPVDRFSTAYNNWSAPKPSDYAWMGSLIPEQEDASGQQYKRNRYYDPTTGRFTQVDPIGLAGGLNLYGFAGGDPVNFSDPFGLCPECRMGWGAPTAANALKEADYYGSMSNSDRVGLMALGAGAAAGGAAVMAGTASLMASAAPMLPIIPSAMGKLEWLAEKFGGNAVGIANRAVTQGTRLIDKGNKCNVNCLIPRPDGAAGWLRVTLDPSQSKVISAGLQSANQVTNGLAKGRFTPVGPP